MLLLSVASGEKWLGTFDTAQGRCLLIDNELHPQELAHRLRIVAEALKIDPAKYAGQIDVWCLRGALRSIDDLLPELLSIPHGDFRLIGFDAKYRMLTPGTSENDNAAETSLYNKVDQVAMHTGAACVLIHHLAKGDASAHRLTDLGAGGGAQSRACDAHIVLRENEECVTLQADVRSFPAPEPLSIRFEYPVWRRDDTVDPTALLTPRKIHQAREDQARLQIVRQALEAEPRTMKELCAATRLSREVLRRLIDLSPTEFEQRAGIRGNRAVNTYCLRDSGA